MINQFINDLASYNRLHDVFNPYKDPAVKNNLRAYLEYMVDNYKNGILLVGEAPGHKGCKITGIPFTSGSVIKSKKNKIFRDIGHHIILSVIESENTAKIVWNYLEGKKTLPLFWNSFPFHPHPKNNKNKNRPPSKDEVDKGISYLKQLANIFKPQRIAGIGRAGEASVKLAFGLQEDSYIRHPSYGGKSDFIKGMNKII